MPFFFFYSKSRSNIFFFFNFRMYSLSFLKNKANNRISPLAYGQAPEGWSQEANGCTGRGQGQKAEHSGPVFASSPDPAGQRVSLRGGAGRGAMPPSLNGTRGPSEPGMKHACDIN